MRRRRGEERKKEGGGRKGEGQGKWRKKEEGMETKRKWWGYEGKGRRTG